jgi:WD40 repeat protein
MGLGAALLRQSSWADRRADAKPRAAAPPAADPHQARTDRFGDPLPSGAVFRLGSLRLRHKTSIHTAAYAAGGRLLAAGGDDGVIRFWDPATGKEVRHTAGQVAVACSPDGKTLATFKGEAVILYDVATAKQLRKLPHKAGFLGGALVPLVFAPDGRTVAALAGDGSVSVWDVATGRERIHVPAHAKPIVCLGFAPDGKSVLTVVGTRTEDIIVRLWDSATGKEVRTVRVPAPGPKAWLRPLAFSPDGKTIALEEAAEARRKEGPVTNVFTEYRVYLADAATGRKRRRLDAESEVVWSAAFSPDCRTVACQRMDGSVSAWDAATGKVRFIQRGYPDGARPDGAVTLAFTPDGKTLATVGDSSAVHLWDVATGRELLANPEAHHGAIACVAFAPDGKTVATGSNDHTIRLWDPATGRQRLGLAGHASGVRRLVFSRDGRTLVSAGGDDTIRLWDPATGKERHTLKEERKSRSSYINYGVHALVFPLNGKTLVSWGEDQMLRVWDLATGKELAARQIHLYRLSETQLEPDKSPETLLADHIQYAAFTPEGKTALLVSDKTIYVVEVASGREAFEFPSPAGLTCLALSPDGQTLVTGCVDKSVRLFEMATGKQVLRATLPDTADMAAFAPDGRSVAVGASFPGDTIRILDVATGKERAHLKGQGAYVGALAFRPDGNMLASGLSDTTTLLWAVATAPPRPPKSTLAADRLDQLWAALAGTDAVKAHAAIWTLAANPEQAVTLLSRRLRPAPPIDPQRLQALIAHLDNKQFAEREKASRELKKLGAGAEAALRAILKRPPSPEVRRRVEAILATPPPWPPQDADARRRTRAIQVLEGVGSPAAVRVLDKLAGGAGTARETDLAAAARQRLSQRVR